MPSNVPFQGLLGRGWHLCLCLLALLGGMVLARGEAMLELFQVNWNDLIQKMPELAEAGYTSLWLPPPAKAGSGFSVGYDLFDPFDLGDKNQRGTTATKYGTKDQLIKVVETAHRFGIRVYFDNIMNHRGFDVPGYDTNTPTNIYPALVPKDFHLQMIPGGFNRNWPSVQDYGNQWDVQYEPLSGLIDLANEPGSVNGNFGNTLGSTTTKPTFIRQLANPEYYADPTQPNIGGGWRPFSGSNGVPISEYVEAYEIRAAMWTLYTTKCDGFRLDAVKHVPSNFFGDPNNLFAGYTGGIQAIYDWVHGYGTNLNSNYLETDDCRNSCFDSEAPRNDALLFGEHLGPPPSYGEYITAGMRLLNTPMRSAVDGWAGGGSGSGLDQRDIGAFGANQGVQFAQDQDHGLCCVNNRSLHNAYYFMHEGIPMIYSDGFNFAGPPSSDQTFPIVPLANYLGQYGDNQMPEVCFLHHQLARGGTRSRWSDANIVAWERYDYRDITSGDAFTNADATVVFFAANNKTSYPGDIMFDDGIPNRVPDGYYGCANGSPSRGYAMRVGFPPGSVLSQLASSSPGSDRACAKLLVHRATTDPNQARATTNAPNAADRLLVVNTTPPPGGGAIELVIPSGGWVIYGYQWPEPSRANGWTNALTFRQGRAPVPTVTVYRKDGVNGDPGFNPLYPFKMRGSVDASGAIVRYAGEGNIPTMTNTYAIRVPVLTNAPFDLAIRCDASAANILAKMDGGMDLNSQMGIGATTGLDRRDNQPGAVSDVFLGYEQAALQFRYGPEKFAAKNVARNNVTSLGAETYYYTTGGTTTSVNGSGNGANIATSTATWVYHDPAAAPTVLGGGPSTQMNPTNPAPNQAVDIWVKVGYNFQTNRCYIYYTTDGSIPEGAFGTGEGSTRVIAAAWVNHDSSDSTIDWFKATIPGTNQVTGVQVRYKIGLYQENIGTISDADSAKLYGLTQFGLTNFNPTTVTVWTHNDRNTNNTQTGLSTGFHILRARSFLPRAGKSGVYNTFLQTFYYDGQLPTGVIAFPASDGSTITSSSYTVVVRTDSSVTEANYTITDANGQVSGVATSVTPDPNLSQQYMNYPQEYRFNYSPVASNRTAVITVTLKTLSTSAYTNRVTTLTRTVQASAPPMVLQIGDPATDGSLLVLNANDTYTIQTCFTPTLTTNDASLFSIYINGTLQPRSGYIFRPPGALAGCPGMRNLLYSWTNAPSGSNTIQVVYTNGFTLSATRTVAVARIGDLTDSDGDGVPNWMEILAGTNPYDANSFLHITGLTPGHPVELAWSSIPNKTYQVLSTTNWAYPMSAIPSAVVTGDASNAISHWFDPAPDATNKFYRIQLVQ
jgi:hypothetical protein